MTTLEKATAIMERVLAKQQARTDASRDYGIRLAENCVANLKAGRICDCCKNLVASINGDGGDLERWRRELEASRKQLTEAAHD